MAAIAELVLTIIGKDEASKTLKDVSGEADTLGQKFAKATPAIVGASVAVSTAGAGLEALARSQQESNVIVGQNAALLGISTDAYRDLATSISNAGFPLEDVNALLRTAAQEGLKGDQLKEFANFWDDVGDATGLAADKLAEGATGLRAVGIAAGQEKEALAAFGFVTDHTKLGVDGLLGILEKKGDSLHDFGINIDDTAAVLGLMEKQLGLTGRAASDEFEKALDKSGGTLEGLLGKLGLTKEQFTAMRKEVDASSGVIERNAAIQDDTITVTQRLKHAFDEFLFSNADVIKGMSDFAPIMMAAGPAVTGLTTAMKFLGTAGPVAAGALRAVGMALLTPPLGIIVAIATVLIMAYVFRDEIIAVFKAVWEYVGPTVILLGRTVVGAFQSVLDFATDHWPEIATLISGPFAPITLLATDAFGVRSALVGAFKAVLSWTSEHWPEIATIISGPFAPLVILATDAFGIRSAFLDSLSAILDFTTDKMGKIGDAFVWFIDHPLQWTIDRVWQLIHALQSIPSPGDILGGIGDAIGGVGGSIGGALGFAEGGVVPGPIGAPRLAVVHGGEEVLTPQQRRSGVGSGAAGVTVHMGTVNIYTPQDAGRTARDIGFTIAANLRARGVWVGP